MTQYLREQDFDRGSDAAKMAGWDGDGWYFWDETQSNCYGPYATQQIAEQKLTEYAKTL